ncbi:DedA family protein [Fodinisporobacter ferrooxydans]|uniref:DedA family protein n=1 Tax=Fodinisporobacter ferrooxydans TaxID=2901836 RepID=A0ABY4CQB0_9BACL|nr:DedA family protein [Alicyclobacillaceae bacterium MYW30-H2]
MSMLLHVLGTFVMHLINALGYTGIVIAMAIESACIPLPSEVIMPFAGYLVWKGHFSLIGITLAGTIGNVIGSLVAYYVGYIGGRPFIERFGSYVFLSRRHLHSAEVWFAKYGSTAVFFGRILPFIRTFISLPAGIARMPIGRFIVYTALGSLPWSYALGLVGYKLGQHWEGIAKYMHPFTYITIAVVVVVFLYTLLKKRSRYS